MSALQRRPAGSVYGRVVTGDEVEQAALTTLRATLPDYLREVERQRGREPGALARPRGYIVASSFEKWPEDQLPVVVVISPGLAGAPRTGGDKRVMAGWSLAVGVIASAADLDRTRANALVYVAAVRLAIAQQQTLGGLALGVSWLDESYEVLPYSDTRSLMAAQAIFTVTVADVVTYSGGPWTPDLVDPYEPPEWPEARRVSVDVVAVPLDQDIELTLADHEE